VDDLGSRLHLLHTTNTFSRQVRHCFNVTSGSLRDGIASKPTHRVPFTCPGIGVLADNLAFKGLSRC